ncbi:MAG: IS256 family transposase [bacterium]
MAGYKVSVANEMLPGLLGEGDGMAKLVEAVLNQVLEAQMSEHLGAAMHERSEERQGYRNGTRARTLYTRVGPVSLQVPQARDGSFSPDIFKRYQRSEQAFVLALMEMVVNGVSTRKVTHITEELCGASFSKSTVSALCTALDPRVRAFNERRLEGTRYPFLIIDAMVIKVRRDEAVRPMSALICSGVNAEGNREILGVKIGDSESLASWDDTLGWLKARGLSGVDLVVSDAHSGLIKAVQKHFQGALWQRCQVHLLRNVVGHVGHKDKAEIAAAAANVLRATTVAEARERLATLAQQFPKAVKAIDCLEAGLDDALAVLTLPEKYRLRLRTTNMQERLNEEVRRRERVIRIFPNEASALRLIGAVLSEHHEAWQDRKYLDMGAYHEWKAAAAERAATRVVAFAG